MELNERFSVLIQGAQIAQSKGVLSLDDAVYVKNAIESVKRNENLDIAAKILVKTVEVAQLKGCYTLRDAYALFIASHEIENLLPKTVTEERTEVDKSEN